MDRLRNQRDLHFERTQRSFTVIQFGRQKYVRGSVSVAQRPSIDLGPQPVASKKREIYPSDVEGTVLQRRRGSSERSSVTLDRRAVMSRRGGAGVKDDSETGLNSFWASCGVRASKGTRRSGDDTVNLMSPC